MGWIRTDLGGARLVYTDRRGGSSHPPFDALNLARGPLGGRVDDPATVEANRERAGRLLGPGLGEPERWVPIRQVHGAATVVCGAGDAPSGPVDADAVVVTEPGPVAVVLTADCPPLALVGERGAAAVHGGWRGLLAGVVEAAVEALDGVVRHAVLGACIRACCYEFGDADLASVSERYGDGVRGTTRSGTPALDLPATVRAALAAAGARVPLLDVAVCTSCTPDFFSHRRDGVTGRQALLVGMLPEGA